MAFERRRLNEQVMRTLRNAQDDFAGRDEAIRLGTSYLVREANQTLAFAHDRVRDASAGAIDEGETALGKYLTRLTHGSQVRLNAYRVTIDQFLHTIAHRSDSQLVQTGGEIDHLRVVLALRVRTALESSHRNLEQQRSQTAIACRHRIDLATSELTGALNSLLEKASAVQRAARNEIETSARIVVGMGPEATLRRGCTIVRDATGGPIPTKGETLRHQELVIQFRDGELDVQLRSHYGEAVR